MKKVIPELLVKLVLKETPETPETPEIKGTKGTKGILEIKVTLVKPDLKDTVQLSKEVMQVMLI